MTGRSLVRLTDVDHGGAWKQLTVERMTLQAQYDGASNLYWRLVRRRQVKRDWNKITGCESCSEEVGHGPEARLGSRICHSRDGSMCDYGAATPEGLIVRSIHRYCQFHPRGFKKWALRHCPLVNMWWASFGRTSAGRSTFSRCSWPPRRCLRRRRRGVTAGCPHMRRLEMALVRMRHPQRHTPQFCGVCRCASSRLQCLFRGDRFTVLWDVPLCFLPLAMFIQRR